MRVARDPEVEQLHNALPIDHDVVGLDVAVNDPGIVRVGEPGAQILHERQAERELQRRRARQPLSQRLAIDVLHRHERATFVFPEVVDNHDVRVTKASQGARFAGEALAELLVVEVVILEEFDGDEALQTRIPREVQRSHPTFAEAVLDLVSTDLPDFHAERRLPPPVILAQESNLDAATEHAFEDDSGRLPPLTSCDTWKNLIRPQPFGAPLMIKGLARRVHCVSLLCLSVLFACPSQVNGQTSGSVAPTLIPISGTLVTADGLPRAGSVLLVVSLYDTKEDTAPRWIEQQAVTTDAAGRYTIQFGSTRPEGLPTDLFTGGGVPQWIGITVASEPEQPRLMLVTVPYAVKAASADTLAGKPATEFVLSSSLRDDLRAVLSEEGIKPRSDIPLSNAVTLNVLQKGDGAGGTTDAVDVIETGGNLGVGTASPGDRLHVFGRMRVNTSPSGGSLIATEYGGVARITAAASGGGGTVAIGREPVLVHGQTAGNYSVELWSGANGSTPTLSAWFGNIGIGTLTPQDKLDVRGGRLRLNTDGGTGGAIVSEYGGTTRITSASSAGGGTIAIGREPVLVHGQPAGNYSVEIWSGNNGSVPTVVASAGNVYMPGSLQVDGNIAAKYQDVAEWVDATEPLEQGMIVTIDPHGTNRVSASTRSYDTRIAGAVSAQPGLLLGEPGPGRAPVAQSGRVRIKADATYGAIRPGDLLVTSPTKGHAMRPRGSKARPGTVIGKALEALPSGRGEILALLTLQ